MPKWSEYTKKNQPSDNDIMMIEDKDANVNKLLTFSGLSDWIVEKLKKNNVISGALKFKGSSAYASLPTNPEQNDYYYSPDGNGTDGAGYYAWDGTAWIFIGNNDKGVDSTFTVEGAAADSKAVGDKFAKVDSETASLKEDLSDYSVDVIGAENNIIPYPYKSTIVSESILIQSSGRNITAVGTATRKSTFTIFGSWGNTTDMFCVAGETYMVCGIDIFTRIVFFNASGNEVLTVIGNGEPQIFTVPQSAVGCNMYWQANINVKTEYDESIRPRIYNINETILKNLKLYTLLLHLNKNNN